MAGQPLTVTLTPIEGLNFSDYLHPAIWTWSSDTEVFPWVGSGDGEERGSRCRECVWGWVFSLVG